jgi:uncharacterized membrane protein YgdD (TMEM256/DUF423 family)
MIPKGAMIALQGAIRAHKVPIRAAASPIGPEDSRGAPLAAAGQRDEGENGGEAAGAPALAGRAAGVAIRPDSAAGRLFSVECAAKGDSAVNWIATGALLAALAVVAGAFGAHALAARLDPHALSLWETAARYLMYGGLGLALLGLLARQEPARGAGAAGWCLLAGSLIFSGTVFGLALGGPRWLGAVTPLGGTLLIAGLLLFAWAALR